MADDGEEAVPEGEGGHEECAECGGEGELCWEGKEGVEEVVSLDVPRVVGVFLEVGCVDMSDYGPADEEDRAGAEA